MQVSGLVKLCRGPGIVWLGGEALSQPFPYRDSYSQEIACFGVF
jgi:hypothetical protein